MNSPDPIDAIHATRIDALAIIEDIGEAAGLLREAEGDERNGARHLAIACLEDALNLVSQIELKASALAARIANLAGGPSVS